MATVDQRDTGAMSPETAKLVLHIFKWLGISLAATILALAPPASWVAMALTNVDYPWVVFAIFYGIYAIVGFICFLCYLHDLSKNLREARSGFFQYVNLHSPAQEEAKRLRRGY